jgi:Spy/CpxP family protein refolding chaperone
MRARLWLVLMLTCGSLLAQPRERMRPPERLLPPAQWWHDAALSAGVKLSAAQQKQLDGLNAQGEEIAKLERDLTTATRDIRTALEAENASSKDIIAAGDRAAALRTTLFNREIRLLAAQREILTKSQWAALENALEERRPPRGEGRGLGGPPPGGMGGRGGRPPRF